MFKKKKNPNAAVLSVRCCAPAASLRPPPLPPAGSHTERRAAAAARMQHRSARSAPFHMQRLLTASHRLHLSSVDSVLTVRDVCNMASKNDHDGLSDVLSTFSRR